jgi:nicotinamidase-related amidase
MSTHRIIPDDTIVLFADLQAGIADLPMTVPAARLRKGVSGLARLDNAPVRLLPELAEVPGKRDVILRTYADSLRSDEIREALAATGRKTLLISGVATELAVQLPALSAAAAGYRVFVVLDACGGMSARTEQAAMNRMFSVGVKTVSVMTLAGELAGPLSSPEGQQAVPIIFEMATAG